MKKIIKIVTLVLCSTFCVMSLVGCGKAPVVEENFSEDAQIEDIETTATPSNNELEELICVVPYYKDILEGKIEDDELWCLTIIVCQETGGGWDSEGNDCEELLRLAIANVVINQCDYYKQTIREVCGRPANWGTLAYMIKFPDWINASTDEGMKEKVITDAYISAWKVLYGGYRILPAGVLFAAEFVQGDGSYAVMYNTAKTPVYFCYGLYMAPWTKK